MKFKLIKQEELKGVEITDFEKEIKVELVITELNDERLSYKWAAQFEHGWMADIRLRLTGLCGYGNTVDSAIISLCNNANSSDGSIKLAVVSSEFPTTYYNLPKLIHTRKLDTQKEKQVEDRYSANVGIARLFSRNYFGSIMFNLTPEYEAGFRDGILRWLNAQGK